MNIEKEREITARDWPFLYDYPGDIMEEYPEKRCTLEEKWTIFDWEIELAVKLLQLLLKTKEPHIFTLEEYTDFYNVEIFEYWNFLVFSPVHDNLEPNNVKKYWAYRIDESLPWDASNNVGIDVESIIKHRDYLRSEELSGINWGCANYVV